MVGGRPRRPVAKVGPGVVTRIAERGIVRPTDGGARHCFGGRTRSLVASEEVGELQKLRPVERQ
jgi:hypothetical protein